MRGGSCHFSRFCFILGIMLFSWQDVAVPRLYKLQFFDFKYTLFLTAQPHNSPTAQRFSMQRTTQTFPLSNLNSFKIKALRWANQYTVLSFSDSNEHTGNPYHRYEALLACGTEDYILHTRPRGAFRDLKTFFELKKDWLFGFLSYDLKNDTEILRSENTDAAEFPDMHFFQPEAVLEIQKGSACISCLHLDPAAVFAEIEATSDVPDFTARQPITMQPRITKAEYLKKIAAVKKHIQLGDIYEMNFCQEFYAEEQDIDPLHLFEDLNKQANAPFAAFYKLKNRYLLCASPERFLQKSGRKLITQPIKGTAPRDADPQRDAEIKNELLRSQKNRSENVMIVDLVRNDLARSCKAGTVKTEELYGIYGFKKVWQMISTVVGELREDTHFIDALKAAYAMGSMTGAPKIRAMELIEKYEKSKRGLYSGAVGYFTPNGDFDFNVVIRSLIYNELTGYLSFQVGGAITAASDAEEEYAECLLKGQNISQVVGSKL